MDLRSQRENPRGERRRLFPVARGDPIDHRLRHGPCRRELASYDRDESVVILEQRVFPRDLRFRNILVTFPGEGTKARIGAHDVRRGNFRLGKSLVDRFEEVLDVVGVREDDIGITVEVRVRRPDQSEIAPRKDEEDSAVAPGSQCEGVAVSHFRPRKEDVNSLSWPDRRARWRRSQPVEPHAGRVHDASSLHAERRPREAVHDVSAVDSTRGPVEFRDLGVVGNGGSPRRRLLDDRENKAGVVRPRIVVDSRSFESTDFKPRLPLRCFIRTQPHASRQGLAFRENVVYEQSEPKSPASRSVVPIRWDQEGERMDESRRLLEEHIPLADRRSDQADLVGSEIAQAPVYKPRGLPARAAREIATFDQRGRETAGRRIPRDSRADDAAPDDQELKGVPLHPPKVLRPRFRVEPAHADTARSLPSEPKINSLRSGPWDSFGRGWTSSVRIGVTRPTALSCHP